MELTEDIILMSLITGDIHDLDLFCADYVKKYCKNRDPFKSISRKKYLDFITDFHTTFLDFMERYK